MADQFSAGRREFMMRMALLAGSTLVSGDTIMGAGRGEAEVQGTGVMGMQGAGMTVTQKAGLTGAQGTGMTVRQVIAALLADIPGAPFPKTVDTIKAGSLDQTVTGIVTTMFATNEVIAKAIRLGASFIIAHEPTYYNHADETKWLGDDPVLKAKQGVLKEHGITVWRFHDGIHQHNPDGIRMGVMQALGWEKLYNPNDPELVVAPVATMGDMIALLKKNLGIDHVKYIGDPGQMCSKLVLLPGAAGGQKQIGAIQQYQPDLLICGELNEWETSEYVRDARYLGEKIALVVLGHSVSEEPGMEWLVPVLQQKAPGIPVTHIVSGDAFSWG
ncbi:MAG TPA: Nif3-like dinuclear metal center hexameric protein [Puia sp.]|nr:Nif3-like dinuclear metal center hexameric protein [Puia sp.]